MDAMREQVNRPLVVGIAAFVAGLIIGLVVLGWWIWPVQWTDAGPDDLRQEYKEIYLRMAIDSYTVNQNSALAQQRITEVGEDAPEVLAAIAATPGDQAPGSIQAFQALAPGGPAVVEGTPAATEAAGGARSLARTLLPIMCVITLLLAAGLVAVFLMRNRVRVGGAPAVRRETARPAAFPDYTAEGEGSPIAQFMTTYQLGNDLYDDSFSIDSQAGEFLGECGVGISETIGVGDPKRVTAFEVWLFDKNDIQTVTQVLMSEHAFADEATRQRLAAKGEPVLAEAGRELVLETATLRLVSRVVDLAYGSGALPEESFFERLTLELLVWQKA
jgi:hypothetical protein